MSRPNILWICTDSQRFDTLGCTGNRHVHTPNLDGLVRGGVLLQNAFSQSPVCTPSRGSFLTGRYPITTRLRRNGQAAPPDLRLLPKILRENGYVCGLSGKLHLNACDHRLLLGEKWWEQKDSRHYFHGTETRLDDGYDEFYWDHGAHLEHASSDWVRWRRERGLSLKNPAPRADCGWVRDGFPKEESQAGWCVDKAIGFLQAHAGNVYPWMFSVNIFDPHYPFDPPAEFLEPYLSRLDEIPLAPFEAGDAAGRPAWWQAWHSKAYPWPRMTTRDHQMLRAAYWAMCAHVDWQIGRLLAALDASGQRENTLVIFMSDHGEMLGDQGLYAKGPAFYEGAVHVPLIFSWPGQLPSGREIGGLVELTDLAPTLLEAAGLPAEAGMQGRSQMALLRGETGETGRDDVFCEYLDAMPGGHFASMVRTANAKLTRFHSQNTGELFDLAADPEETRNLWDDPASAPLKIEMLARLSDRFASTADPQFPRVGVY